MRYKDYYQILGVERSADAEQIKRAYRKSARRYHPDVSKERNAEEKFKEAQEAYEVLRDAEKRAAYDQLGRDFRGGQQFRPPPDWARRFGAAAGAGASPHGPADLNGFSDFFSSLFGGAHPANAPAETDAGVLEVSVEEVFTGTKRRASLSEQGRTRQVDVQIPQGIAAGQSLRVASAGRPALIFRVNIRPHALYTLHGKDVQVELPLAPWEAALGTKVSVPTLGGTVGVTVPAGAQSGQKLRLRGRGLPGAPPGDQIIVVKLVNPPSDSPQAKAAYDRMKQELDFDPRAGWPPAVWPAGGGPRA